MGWWGGASGREKGRVRIVEELRGNRKGSGWRVGGVEGWVDVRGKG